MPLHPRARARMPLALGATLLIGATAHARGKFPPDSLRNVQAMPEGTSVKQVVDAMRGFTRALAGGGRQAQAVSRPSHSRVAFRIDTGMREFKA